jgi:hypothetical protein
VPERANIAFLGGGHPEGYNRWEPDNYFWLNRYLDYGYFYFGWTCYYFFDSDQTHHHCTLYNCQHGYNTRTWSCLYKPHQDPKQPRE